MQKNKVIIIVGTTASGKSAYAMELAKKQESVIINADSMQIYKEIPIISASPSTYDKNKVEHKLYNFLSIKEHFSVAKWIELATKETKKALLENKQALIVGGTGFYIKSLLEGISQIPEIMPNFYKELEQEIETKGLKYLYNQLQKIDPEFSVTISENDTQRITRALAVFNATGKNISYFHKQGNKKVFNYENDVVLINRERQELYKRSNERFEIMIKQGAIEEAKNILKGNYNLTSGMKALGLEQIILHLKGEKTLEEAKEEAKKQTRNYIKRQSTFFKNQLKPSKIVNM